MNYQQIQRRQQGNNNNARFYQKTQPDVLLKEAIREPQYSRKDITTAKSQTIPFFRDHSGSSLITTNNTYNGIMASNESFSLEGFSARTKLGMAKDDFLKFYNYSVLVFKLSDKVYLRVPMSEVPSGGGVTGLAVIDGSASAEDFYELSNCDPNPNMFYPVLRTGNNGKYTPVTINPNQKFEVEIVIDAPTDFSAAFFLTTKMHGERTRE